MSVVYVNPIYPWQVAPNGLQAPSTQMDYRSMIGEVTSWNPNVDPEIAGRWINNYYRKLVDMRSWYGLKVRGQVSVRAPYSVGQVSCTFGNPVVNGTGTNWTAAAIEGMQFRTGFTSAYQGVTKVLSPTRLQLDTPFAGNTGVTAYEMTDCYVDFGANIKRLLWAVNQQQGWPMAVNVKIQEVNAEDTWRTNLGWSKVFAVRSMTPGGSFLNECWPSPASAQSFPFEAYTQPSNLTLDSDCVVPWIRTDIIVTRAVADALVHKGRKSDYYDPVTAGMKIKEFNEAVEQMVMNDDNMDVSDVTWDYDNGIGFGGPGSAWAQMHA